MGVIIGSYLVLQDINTLPLLFNLTLTIIALKLQNLVPLKPLIISVTYQQWEMVLR